MKKIKLYYSQVQNMGDLLNELLTTKLFEMEIEHAKDIYEADFTGIGSFLGSFYNSMSIKRGIKKNIINPNPSLTTIWSSGFMQYPIGKEVPLKRNIEIASVRGELSKKRLEKILNRELDITTGDAGLLTSDLVANKIVKEYKIGVIPHYKEFEDPIFDTFRENKSFEMIDLRINPYDVINKISKCEYIISSSLHGLIVADSFKIPNIRIVATDNLLGDGFKFDDYYSSFGVQSYFYDLMETEDIIDENFIIDNYKINPSLIDRKKHEIFYALKNQL